MKFGEVIESIREGKLARRKIWATDMFVTKCPDVSVAKSELTQTQASTSARMKLLNSNSRNVIIGGGVKLVNAGSDMFGSKSTIRDYAPDWIDIFAEDWELI